MQVRLRSLAKTGGFTLLEVAISLCLIVLMIGMAVSFTPGVLSEMRLREPARQLKLFAKTARRLALIEKKAYEIKFTEKGFSISPFSPKDGQQQADKSEDAESEEVEESEDSNYELSSRVTCQVQPWGEEDWQDPQDQHWIFQTSGLCQPFSVRFNENDSWIELSFSPLTAAADDERSHFE